MLDNPRRNQTERKTALVARELVSYKVDIAAPGEGLRCCLCLHTRRNQTERKTALVARELVSYKVDIAALSETRFSKQGQLEEVGVGYTFFWSGQLKAERRDAGVAFAIQNDIVGRLPYLCRVAMIV
ncbi:unnamed protein product [Schistocephalus solidus]|uniref:Endo/exonuclease/phosphatase domain-containing protein n=1 Tax=Schistocephalus solidus TaxID=70667 RepID=A0A183SVC0_SCHSO|nr:unnamed protein product [Schistocephalus solidus]